MSEFKPIGQFVKVQGGFAFKSSEFQSTGIPLVRISNIQNNSVVLDSEVLLKERMINENFKVSKGDLLIAMSGATTGKTGVYQESALAYLNQRVGKFVNKNSSQLHYPYLYYLTCFDSFQKELLIDAVGGAQPNISPSQIEKIIVNIPSLKKQEKISAILKSVEKCIYQTEETISKLQKIKTGLMQDLFTRGVDANGKLRPSNEEKPELYKSSPLGMIPKEWGCFTINQLLVDGDIVDVQDGNHGNDHPKSSEFVKVGVPFVMANDVQEDHSIDFEHCSKITQERASRLRIGLAKGGDVLLTHKGTIGNVAIVPDDVELCMLTPQVTYYRIRNNSKKLTSAYLFSYFSSERFQRDLKNISKQSTRDYIGITQQKKFYILVPSLESERMKITEKLSSIQSVLRDETNSLLKMKELKAGLMQDLLTGKVDVKVDKDE